MTYYVRLQPVLKHSHGNDVVAVLRKREMSETEYKALRHGVFHDQGRVPAQGINSRVVVRLARYGLVARVPVVEEHVNAKHFYYITDLGRITVQINERNRVGNGDAECAEEIDQVG